MRAQHYLLATLSLVSLFTLTGCQQAPPAVDLGPQLNADGNRRSVVLDSSLQHHIASRQPASSGLPWYADRNDFSPAANAGYVQPTVQSSVTITRDSQYSSNGQIHDNFSSTIYRREYRQSVR